MLAKKLLKRLGVVFGSLAVVTYVAFWFLFYNPLEGRVAEVRDIVPRGSTSFFIRLGWVRTSMAKGWTFPTPPTSPSWAEISTGTG